MLPRGRTDRTRVRTVASTLALEVAIREPTAQTADNGSLGAKNDHFSRATAQFVSYVSFGRLKAATAIAERTVVASNSCPQKRDAPMKLHCSSCHRPEYHRSVKFSPLVNRLLPLFSCGLTNFIKPCRCACCGTFKLARRARTYTT